MTIKRSRDFVLADEIRKAAFTPRRGDADELVALLTDADESLERAVIRALALVPDAGADAAIVALDRAKRPWRGRVARLLGKMVEESPKDEYVEKLYGLLRDEDLKTAANAIQALGACPSDATERALLSLWDGGLRREHRRGVVRSLGKAGGSAAHEFLRALADDPEDGELNRLRAQALLIIDRRQSREHASEIDVDARPKAPLRIRLYCRAGLDELLLEELQEKGLGANARRNGPGRVELESTAPLSALFASRLWERIAFVPKLTTSDRAGDSALVAAMSSPGVTDLMRSLTRGVVRYRIDWPDATKARIWRLAQSLSEASAELVNDPTESTWELGVLPVQDRGSFELEVRPKRLVDPRFAYRKAFVYAASHPTVAAAIVRFGGVEPKDVVWDPFVGSGLELIERAKTAPYAALWGTDIEAAAIAAATENLRSAAVERHHLVEKSCLEFDSARPSLIITNPPMGRRVSRGVLEPLIEGFVKKAAAVLTPGGRLVLASPLPHATKDWAHAAGLELKRALRFDMGGFDAELQRFDKKR